MMPIYLVKAPTQPPTEKLVDAANAASARNHVARQLVTSTVAKQADLFRVAKAGGDVEKAGDEPAAAEPQTEGVDNEGQQTAEDTTGKGGKAK
jgi:hypothetical protein